jgi:hypothetical protein
LWEEKCNFTAVYGQKIKPPGSLAAGREQRGDIRFMFILTKKNRIFNAGYALPDIINSYEEYQKFHTLDLRELDTFSLWQELFKVKAALAQLDLRQQPWLFTGPGQFIPAFIWLKARYRAIKEELNRRERDNV